jgi:hypothetical protein
MYHLVLDFCLRPLYNYIIQPFIQFVFDTLEWLSSKIKVCFKHVFATLANYLIRVWQKIEDIFVMYIWDWLLWPLRCLSSFVWMHLKQIWSIISNHLGGCLNKLWLIVESLFTTFGKILTKIGNTALFLQQELSNTCYRAWLSLQQLFVK